MNKFFNKIGRYLINVAIICLILLISYQIVIKTDTNSPELKKLSNSIQRYLRQEEKPESVPVLEETAAGLVTIDLMQDYSLSEVWVLKNGQRVANFADGIVTIDVKNGDFISIDARNISVVLWFELTSISENISNWSEGRQYRTAGSYIELGTVEIYSKL